jgi:hypothetical protein
VAEARYADVHTPPVKIAHIMSQQLGWRIVPAARDRKSPGVKNWPDVATTNWEQIEAWWHLGMGNPLANANVCVVTGRASGVWVLDVDPRHGGDEALAALEAEHGSLPPTMTIRTPSGGRHLYWRYPEVGEVETGTNLGAPAGVVNGLDTRGWHGQVMAPLTSLNGGRYEPLNDHEPAEAPPWLLSLARRVPRSERGTGGSEGPTLPDVEAMIEEAADVAPGGQEDHLFRFLCKLRAQDRTESSAVDLGWELASRFTNQVGHNLGDWSREHVEAKTRHVWARFPAGGSELATDEQANWAAILRTSERGEVTDARLETATMAETPGESVIPERPRAEARNTKLPVRPVSLGHVALQLLRDHFICDHGGLAKLFLSLWLEDVQWSQEEERFMVFSQRDGRWVHDGRGHEAVHRLVSELAERLHRVCEDEVAGDREIQRLLAGTRDERAEGRRRATSIRSWGQVVSGTGNVRAVIAAIMPAANDCGPTDFDQAAHLLNVGNGTYDVTTGELRPHRQADMLTHALPLKLDLALAGKPLEEVAPLFHGLLWRMCGAPGELDEVQHRARYEAVRRYLGYQLHGSNPAKRLGVFIGESNIGKNQVLEIVGEILRELAFMGAKPSLLVRIRNDRHDGDESPLRGKRMVVLNELSKNQVLDENQVLRFVNPTGASVSLRRLHRDPVTVPITWKITVSTNDLPSGELTPQVQNRLAIFPLSQVQVPWHEQWDIKGAILRGGTHDGVAYEPEVDAILAHLTRWWHEWWVASQETGAEGGGLLITDEMRAALDEYVGANVEPHKAFVDECLNVGDPGGYVESKVLVERYHTYVTQLRIKDAPGRRVLYQYVETLEGVTRVEKPRAGQSPLLLGYRGISFVNDGPDLGALQAVASTSSAY